MAVSETSGASDVNLKHRLVGACVLVAVAVIVLPMLLAGEDEQEYSITPLPNPVESDNEDFVSKIKPREDDDGQDGSQNVSAAESDVQSQTQQDLQALLDSSGVNQSNDQNSGRTTALDPDPAPQGDGGGSNNQNVDDPDAAGDGRGWIVRVGTFKEAANANQIMLALRDKGFEPQSAEVETGVGRATRVWVGPYSKRVTASRILNRLEGEIGEKGFISAYP